MRKISDRLRAAREREEGFTIIEVMVAMLVFALISVGVAAGITSTLVQTQDSRAREIAVGIASDQLDVARTAANVFNVGTTTSTVTQSGMSFTVTQTAQWVTSTGAGDVCGGGGGPLSYKRVAETVSWAHASGVQNQSVSMNSLVAPTAALSSGNLGTIIIRVSKADGTGNAGVTVSIAPAASNPGGATAVTSTIPVTDASGCSYATNVTPGSYDVTLSKTGNIDDGSGNSGVEDSTPTKTISVAKGGTGSATFLYDAATTYSLTYADPNAAQGTVLTTPSSLTAAMWHGTTYVNNISTSTVQLFPFATGGGYSAAPSTPQTCAAVDPGNWSTPSGTAVAPADTSWTPSNNSVVVPVQGVAVKLGNAADSTIKATQIAPASTSTGTPSCATKSTYTFTGLSSTKTYTLGLPYGTYTLAETNAALSASAGSPSVTAASGVSYTASSKTLTLDPRR